MENPEITRQKKAIWMMKMGASPREVAKTTGLSYYWLELINRSRTQAIAPAQEVTVDLPRVNRTHEK